MSEVPPDQSAISSPSSAWRITRLICCGVVAISILSCVAIAAARSNGLTQVTVVALDPGVEPRDHDIPLLKQKDALPDYELVVYLSSGLTIDLGTKPNTSAVDGLEWTLNEPVSVSEVAGVRLQDQDKLISDTITEVQITGDSAEADGYRFTFTTERSAAVGVSSFFRTPIGMAIFAAFFVAVLLMLAGAFTT